MEEAIILTLGILYGILIWPWQMLYLFLSHIQLFKDVESNGEFLLSRYWGWLFLLIPVVILPFYLPVWISFAITLFGALFSFVIGSYFYGRFRSEVYHDLVTINKELDSYEIHLMGIYKEKDIASEVKKGLKRKYVRLKGKAVHLEGKTAHTLFDREEIQEKVALLQVDVQAFVKELKAAKPHIDANELDAVAELLDLNPLKVYAEN